MRPRFLAFLLAAPILVAVSCAQPTKPGPAQVRRVFDYQACLSCQRAYAKAATCSKCKKSTIAVRGRKQFGCRACKIEASTAGNCKRCKKPMAPVAETYVCGACRTSSSQSGNCNKCGKFRKRHVLWIQTGV